MSSYSGDSPSTSGRHAVKCSAFYWCLPSLPCMSNGTKWIGWKQLKWWVSDCYWHRFQEWNDELIAFPRSGYLCCLVTVIFFAAPCCMLLQVIRTKTTEILPSPLILTSFIVSVQWFIVGVIVNDHFIQIPNLMGALLSGTQLLLFLIYSNRQRPTAYTPNSDVPYAIF